MALQPGQLIVNDELTRLAPSDTVASRERGELEWLAGVGAVVGNPQAVL